jgi:AraC-like DNA-binding protein
VKLHFMIDMDKESVWRVVTADGGAKVHLPYVQEAGDFRAHGKYYTTREGLPSYLVKYTAAGEGTLDYGGECVRLPAGHFFWIDCMNPQSYRTSDPAGEWRVLWVHFFGAGCAYFHEQFLAANGGRCHAALPADSPVPALLQSILDLYGKGRHGPDADLSAAAMLTTIMSGCVSAASRKTEGTATGAVREARDFLLLHYAEPVTLDILAHRLSLSKYHLQKMFRRQVGQTPNEFLNDLRLNHAKEFLRATDEPVARIAEAVGFENASYFIRRFKRHEGVTPAVYRRRWQQA